VKDVKELYVPIILGTARAGRQSEKVARFMLNETIKTGIKTEIIDVQDFLISRTDNTEELPRAKILSEKITKADGLIIVSPEYNHGYPGELKIMLDMLYEQYARKPVGFCGVSAGRLGGARAIEQLRLISIEFHMMPIREALYFPMVQDLFDDKGNIRNQSYYDLAKTFLDELIWYAKALKLAREQGDRDNEKSQ